MNDGGLAVLSKSRISFRLARLAVLIALVLGLLLSVIQIARDFVGEKQSLEVRVERVLDVASRAATQAVNTLDTNLAEQVVGGLMSYEFFSGAILRDEFGNVLAKSEREIAASKTRWLWRKMATNFREFSAPLFITSDCIETPGTRM